MGKKQLVVIALIFVCGLMFEKLAIGGEKSTIPFDSDNWEMTGEYKREIYLGQDCLLMKQGARAILKKTEFSDGIIEFDVAFPKMRGFAGVMWRLADSENYEEFYMRAHQSGNPDANQYTPVFNGSPAWQLYYSGRGFGAPIQYLDNEWMRAKIIVSGQNALLYIKDMDIPEISVELLRETQKGKIGFKVMGDKTNLFYARFANFSFISSSIPIIIEPNNIETAKKGTIMSWAVSSLTEEEELDGKFFLTQDDKDSLAWSVLNTESSGIANISKLYARSKDNNTVFMKVIINSKKKQLKKIMLGYSDRIRVFFNDKVFYSGNNTYKSRDYRYLGSIGYFDEIYLPLKKGKNELWMAVSESFGGWGLKAKFENMDGITLNTK